MKNITLIDGQWKLRIAPVLTTEEKALLNAVRTEENREAQRTLSTSLHARSLADVTTEDAAQAQAIYDANKLPDAVLISADITLPEGNGIINCRLNGEHKQIRF